jgi:predicted PurR-regulated permease PerM
MGGLYIDSNTYMGQMNRSLNNIERYSTIQIEQLNTITNNTQESKSYISNLKKYKYHILTTIIITVITSIITILLSKVI